jgi:mannosyltransferase OCH1-like enzyme
MTWHTLDLPPYMKKNVNEMKAMNPEFEFDIYDDNMCKTFIAEHFEANVADAFDRLIPGAYKADLWRLCILYKRGGIYLDIKLKPAHDFKLVELTEEEHFTLDRPLYYIYNGIMACKPANPFLLACIHEIVKNVRIQYYGLNPLAPTGPYMLGKVAIREKAKLNLDIAFSEKHTGEYFVHKGKCIFTAYAQYRIEQRRETRKNPYYMEAWTNKKIYTNT